MREQVSAIYLFEEDLPVNDSFTVAYARAAPRTTGRKQRTLDRERARVALRERGSVRDTTGSSTGGGGGTSSAKDSVAADSAAPDSAR